MDYIAPVAAKVGAKVGLNAVVPGLGTMVDFCEAVKDVSEGNYVGAALNVVFGVFDLFTLGAAGAAKDAAKEVGKNAAVKTVKETAKTTTKNIGRTAAKDIAKGGPKRIIVESAMFAAKDAKKVIGRKFGEELSKGMVGELTEEAFKRAATKAAIQGAGMSLVGSGGKEIAAEMLEGAAYNFLSEFSTETSRQVFKSTTASAAKEAITPVAEQFLKDTFKRELLLNTGKGLSRMM